jgi:hypothetical protein
VIAIVDNIRTLLAAWVGAAIFFSAVVAPGVFGVLRSFDLSNTNEIAGSIVSRTLSVINVSGFVLGLLLIVTTFALRKVYGRRALVLQVVLSAILAAATGAGEWIIASRMRGLRAVMRGGIDQVAIDDPNRLAFAALHGYSVAALSVAIIVAIVSLFVMSNRLRAK